MKREEVQHIRETINELKWITNGNGYIFDGDEEGPTYIELDAKLADKGIASNPAATKRELIEELRKYDYSGVLHVDNPLEKELLKQIGIAEEIANCTSGLNGQIERVISSMEDTHLKLQLQMMNNT